MFTSVIQTVLSFLHNSDSSCVCVEPEARAARAHQRTKRESVLCYQGKCLLSWLPPTYKQVGPITDLSLLMKPRTQSACKNGDATTAAAATAAAAASTTTSAAPSPLQSRGEAPIEDHQEVILDAHIRGGRESWKFAALCVQWEIST